MNKIDYIIGVGCDAQPIFATHYIDDAEDELQETSDTSEPKE